LSPPGVHNIFPVIDLHHQFPILVLEDINRDLLAAHDRYVAHLDLLPTILQASIPLALWPETLTPSRVRLPI